MPMYTRLFQEIITSSIWQQDDKILRCWLTLIALADKKGNVRAAIDGLANIAKITIENCQDAIQILTTYNYIEEIDNGWHLIVYPQIRDIINSDEKKEYMRLKQIEYRLKKKEKVK